MTTISKTKLITLLHNAIDADNSVQAKWKDTGSVVRQWYAGGYESWLGEKAALIKDIIIPALPVKVQTDLLRPLPRKGTKDGDAYGTELLAQHNQDKIRARAYADAIFRKVTEYAFEAEIEAEKARKAEARKAEAEDSEEGEDEIDSAKLATNKAKLMADLSNWVKRLQKSDGEDFDINATITSLQATIAILTK